eukprot:1973049-Rhodomonas_salina.2
MPGPHPFPATSARTDPEDTYISDEALSVGRTSACEKEGETALEQYISVEAARLSSWGAKARPRQCRVPDVQCSTSSTGPVSNNWCTERTPLLEIFRTEVPVVLMALDATAAYVCPDSGTRKTAMRAGDGTAMDWICTNLCSRRSHRSSWTVLLA